MTRVLNVSECPKNWHKDPLYVYVGKSDKFGQSPHYNPYQIGIDAGTRNEVLALYLEHLTRKIKLNTDYLERVYELRDKSLVCHCSPMKCHGDILERLSDTMKAECELHRPGKEFAELSYVGEHRRLCAAKDLIGLIRLELEAESVHELSVRAQEEACRITGYAAWKEYRKKYLDPLMKFKMPEYQLPKEE